MILAKTNLVIAGVTANNFYGIIIGSAVGGNCQPGGSIGDVRLGQVNDVRANANRVGGPRAQLGTLRFRSVVMWFKKRTSSLVLRGTRPPA